MKGEIVTTVDIYIFDDEEYFDELVETRRRVYNEVKEITKKREANGIDMLYHAKLAKTTYV